MTPENEDDWLPDGIIIDIVLFEWTGLLLGFTLGYIGAGKLWRKPGNKKGPGGKANPDPQGPAT